jgi:hypothetical protein
MHPPALTVVEHSSTLWGPPGRAPRRAACAVRQRSESAAARAELRARVGAQAAVLDGLAHHRASLLLRQLAIAMAFKGAAEIAGHLAASSGGGGSGSGSANSGDGANSGGGSVCGGGRISVCGVSSRGSGGGSAASPAHAAPRPQPGAFADPVPGIGGEGERCAAAAAAIGDAGMAPHVLAGASLLHLEG